MHVWRLHFELDNIVSSDVTFGVFVKTVFEKVYVASIPHLRPEGDISAQTGVAPLLYFVKESRFARVLHPRAPALSLCFRLTPILSRNCVEKICEAKSAKFFEPLTTMTS